MQERGCSSGRAEKNRGKKVNEIVRALVGLVVKEGHIAVASDSNSKIGKT